MEKALWNNRIKSHILFHIFYILLCIQHTNNPIFFSFFVSNTWNIQVTATDGDKDRPQNIVYFLTGQGIDPDNPANSKFDINRTTGEIFVLKVRYQKITMGGGKFYWVDQQLWPEFHSFCKCLIKDVPTSWSNAHTKKGFLYRYIVIKLN